MRKAQRGKQALRRRIRFLGFQKDAGCPTFLHLAEPGDQERSSKSLMPQFWTGADYTDLTNQALALTVRDPLEFTCSNGETSGEDDDPWAR